MTHHLQPRPFPLPAPATLAHASFFSNLQRHVQTTTFYQITLHHIIRIGMLECSRSFQQSPSETFRAYFDARFVPQNDLYTTPLTCSPTEDGFSPLFQPTTYQGDRCHYLMRPEQGAFLEPDQHTNTTEQTEPSLTFGNSRVESHCESSRDRLSGRHCKSQGK